MQGLDKLAEQVDGPSRRSPRRNGGRPGPDSAIKVVDRLPRRLVDKVADVSEQDASFQGTFPLVLIKWVDITVFFVDAAGDTSPEAMATLAAKDVSMLQFINSGIVVFEDDFEVVMLHSMSLQPGRSEFWIFPAQVILGRQTVGRVKIEGNDAEVV